MQSARDFSSSDSEYSYEYSSDSCEKDFHEKRDCAFCFGRIGDDDNFFPCNCNLKVHYQCIQRTGRSTCAICGLKYNMHAFGKNLCVVCRRYVKEEPFTRPCNCNHLAIHRGCMEKIEEEKRCKFCDTTYAVQVEEKWECSSEPCKYFAIVSLGLFFLAMVSLSLALAFCGKTFTNWTSGHAFEKMGADEECVTETCMQTQFSLGFLLFPGVVEGLWIDVIYLIIGFVAVGFVLIWSTFHVYEEWVDKRGYRRNTFWASYYFFVIFTSVIVHLFGNAHYAFWCSFDGVLLPKDCDSLPRYDIYTFGSGFFPLIITGLAGSALFGCFRLFFKKKKTVSLITVQS